jgi:hypothetical protein
MMILIAVILESRIIIIQKILAPQDDLTDVKMETMLIILVGLCCTNGGHVVVFDRRIYRNTFCLGTPTEILG